MIHCTHSKWLFVLRACFIPPLQSSLSFFLKLTSFLGFPSLARLRYKLLSSLRNPSHYGFVNCRSSFCNYLRGFTQSAAVSFFIILFAHMRQLRPSVFHCSSETCKLICSYVMLYTSDFPVVKQNIIRYP